MPFDLEKHLPKAGHRFVLPLLHGSSDAYALAVAALALKAQGQMLTVVVANASDGQRLIMPSFGAYTGGLNVLDRALAPLLGRRFEVRMIGSERLFAFPSARLEPDPERVRYQ